ncbi:hypothetical protein EYF80_043940 [Liparis tanakae]|uniref:Uncharacterized protein n=1 Tax=Liparis tanakae TaxID=230148 RepID=A0A4Z2FZR3_9TELE|nr:hypothetical protein EYF80_043940 [Liparis tanakae]
MRSASKRLEPRCLFAEPEKAKAAGVNVRVGTQRLTVARRRRSGEPEAASPRRSVSTGRPPPRKRVSTGRPPPGGARLHRQASPRRSVSTGRRPLVALQGDVTRLVASHIHSDTEEEDRTSSLRSHLKEALGFNPPKHLVSCERVKRRLQEPPPAASPPRRPLPRRLAARRLAARRLATHSGSGVQTCRAEGSRFGRWGDWWWGTGGGGLVMGDW